MPFCFVIGGSLQSMTQIGTRYAKMMASFLRMCIIGIKVRPGDRQTTLTVNRALLKGDDTVENQAFGQ